MSGANVRLVFGVLSVRPVYAHKKFQGQRKVVAEILNREDIIVRFPTAANQIRIAIPCFVPGPNRRRTPGNYRRGSRSLTLIVTSPHPTNGPCERPAIRLHL